MKKINVSKLIDLRKRENLASYYVKHYTELQILRPSSIEVWKPLQEEEEKKLAECREEIAKEAEQLIQAIREAEGRRSVVRKIDSLEIIDDLIEIDDYLGLTKKAMKGTTVHVDHFAQKFPGAYKGTPLSTHFTAEFTSNWFVTAIYRDTCKNRKYDLKLSETAKEAYLKNAETLS